MISQMKFITWVCWVFCGAVWRALHWSCRGSTGIQTAAAPLMWSDCWNSQGVRFEPVKCQQQPPSAENVDEEIKVRNHPLIKLTSKNLSRMTGKLMTWLYTIKKICIYSTLTSSLLSVSSFALSFLLESLYSFLMPSLSPGQ